MKVHDEMISALDIQGDTVLTSSPDSTIKITNFVKGLTSDAQSEDCPETPAYGIPDVEKTNITVQVSKTIPLKCKGCSFVKVRPDGKLLVAAGWDGGLRFYSWSKAKFLGLIEAHSPDTITDMFLFDNKIICSGRDHKISFWTMY